jgi:hypothetical protein
MSCSQVEGGVGGFEDQVRQMEDEFNAVTHEFLSGEMGVFGDCHLYLHSVIADFGAGKEVFETLDRLRDMQSALTDAHKQAEQDRSVRTGGCLVWKVLLPWLCDWAGGSSSCQWASGRCHSLFPPL